MIKDEQTVKNPGHLGLKVDQYEKAALRPLLFSYTASGANVTDVDLKGSAFRYGIVKGDVIVKVAVDKQWVKINSDDQFMALVHQLRERGLKGISVMLLDGRKVTIPFAYDNLGWKDSATNDRDPKKIEIKD